MATNDRSVTWDGGYIRIKKLPGGKKRKTYILYRKINGALYEISTRCDNEGAAKEHLGRFLANPQAYKADPSPEPDPMPLGPQPITLDDALIDAYCAACARGFGENATPNSEKWIYNKRWYLQWWRDQLAGVDLRSVDRRLILGKLVVAGDDGAPVKVPSRTKKIEIIKHFYTWLADDSEGTAKIEPQENPTVGIRMPQAKAAQIGKNKAPNPDDVKRVFEKLGEKKSGFFRKPYPGGYDWRQEVVIFLSSTGWHYSEVRRFAEVGEIEPLPKGRGEEGGAILVVKHKSGEPHKTEVGATIADIAKRLRAFGALPEYSLSKTLRRISKELGLETPVLAGNFRHFVATYAQNAGADNRSTADFIGHKSIETTRIYNMRATPARIPTPQDEMKLTPLAKYDDHRAAPLPDEEAADKNEVA